MSNRVRFAGEPAGGARGHQRSESGGGSSSDNSARSSHSARAGDAEPGTPELVTALRKAMQDAEHYKMKAKQLDTELIRVRKELKELSDRNLDLRDRNELLDDERKSLRNENEALKQHIDALAARTRERESWIPAAAAEPAPAEPPRLQRSSSKKGKDRDREPVDSSQKVRLSQRFERGKDGEVTGSEGSGPSSSRPPRARRNSTYIEGWGPGGPLQPAGRSLPGAPVTSRPYDESYVATTMTHPPTISRTANPSYSSVPRSVPRPYVDPAADVAVYEDGTYHPYPLPPEPSQSSHHKKDRKDKKERNH